MKFKSMTFAALAFGALAASCSKDQSGPKTTPADGQAKLTLTINNPKIGKALDADTEGEAFSDAMIFIVDELGQVLNHYHIADLDDISAGTAREFTTRTTASRVFVVGNLGDQWTDYETALSLTGTNGGSLGESLATLQSRVLTLTGLNSITDHITGTTDGALPVAGYSGAINWVAGAADNGTDYGAAVSLTMELLPVRLDITVNNKMTNYDDPDAYEIKDVAVLYSAFRTHVLADPQASAPTGQRYIPAFPADPSVNTGYYRSGYATWDALDPDYSEFLADLCVSYDAPELQGTWAPGGAASTEVFTRTLYAYASTEKPLIVTVRAENTNNDVVYYSAVLDESADLNGETPDYVANGHRYTININLKGDARNGGGGTVDPEIPSVTGFVEVEVTPASWQATAVINKDFE